MEKPMHISTVLELPKDSISCPRCKGYGSCFGDKDGECYICDGDGQIFIVNSGYGEYTTTQSRNESGEYLVYTL